MILDFLFDRGSNRQAVQPRLVKETLAELFQSDEPFAAGYRQFLVEQNRRAPWEPAGLVGKEVRE